MSRSKLLLALLFISTLGYPSYAGTPLPTWTWGCQASCGNPAPGGGGTPTRDPALWPFAATSPWNYPIGSNATYSTAALGDGNTFAQESAIAGNVLFFNGDNFSRTVWTGSTTDPINAVCADAPDISSFASTTYGTNSFSRHIPSTGVFLATTEAVLIVITPDHLTSMEFIDPSFGTSVSCGSAWHQPNVAGENMAINVDLKGGGIWGNNKMAIALNSGDEATPGNIIGVSSGSSMSAGGQVPASRVSALSGLIRPGQLANGIQHALWVAVPAAWLDQNAPGGINAFVWPAAAADSNFATTYGTTGPLFMGGLIAIPSTVNLNAHTFNTTQGKNLALAIQLYGMYVADTSGGFTINVDHNAVVDIPSQAAGSPFVNDMIWVTSQLAVVTNSYHAADGTAPAGGVKLDGADGTLPAPLAPAFDR